MTKQRLKFLRNEAIEEITAQRIREYESKVGVTVALPVPVEQIVEQVLGLDFDWDVIQEQPGEQILGGLDVANRKILINEAHSDLFEHKPGLLRSTIGHEAGHWDIDIDRSKVGHPMLPGIELSICMVNRHASKSDRLIEVLFTKAMTDEKAYRIYKELTAGQDAPEVRSAVDRYQSALLMPKWMIQEAREHCDFTKWPDLYRLAERAEVSISNLTVRLQRLGLIYLRDNDKKIYRSEDEWERAEESVLRHRNVPGLYTMGSITFSIVSGNDQEYMEAMGKAFTDAQANLQQLQLGDHLTVAAKDLVSNRELQEVLASRMKVFQRFHWALGQQGNVSIQRPPDASILFDKVTVTGAQNNNPLWEAKLAASIQKHLQAITLSGIGNLLGPEARQHFEAREVALARLEKAASKLMVEMEEARKRRDKELDEKQRQLEEKSQHSQDELQRKHQERQGQLEQQATELENLRRELDDRAAKHARRQHYKDIKEKFKSWGETFQVTKGTSQLRQSVFWTTVVLLVIFGLLAAWFLFQSVVAVENAHLIASVAKQIAFTLLFVSTAFFFIRWNNKWFQRHADEEFRLKRMELDIDRASWFVEMAFEWKEQKSEEIPIEIIERLTQGLFSDDRSDHSAEPADSLMQALVGAARFKVKLPDGSELEYDRKGVQRLLKQNKTTE